MPRDKRSDSHGGGSGWRFSWRIDRLQKMHELGRAFGLTDDSRFPDPNEPDTTGPNETDTGQRRES